MFRIPCGVGEGNDFANETHIITPLMNTPLNRRHFLHLAALAPLTAGTPFEDIFWTLLNSSEFLFNH